MSVVPIKPKTPERPQLPMKVWVESGPKLVFAVKSDEGQWTYPMKMTPAEARRVASWLQQAADDAESSSLPAGS